MTLLNLLDGFLRRPTKRKISSAGRTKLQVERLEPRIVPSFVDGNGAVVLNLTEQNNGTELVVTFDGPLDSTPANSAQSPTNPANFSIQVPSGNPQVVTSSASSVAINSASYDNSSYQVTLSLGSALVQGQSYRVYINGTANTINPTTPGLVDTNQQPLDGDYDDTASGNFYALFTWTAAGTPLNYTDSNNAHVALSITGPGQLNAWRELDGDFAAGDLTAQADLSPGLAVQQLSVTNGVSGSTTLAGAALFQPGSGGVVIIPPSIPGAFTDTLPAYFQPTAPAIPATTPVVATANNLPYTIQIQPINLPALPALQSAVTAQDQASGPYQGYWLLFGGRTNGLHSFDPGDNFPPQNQNQAIYVVNPTTGQTWTENWSDTNVTSGWTPPLYSTNQQSFQNGDTLYTTGGYGSADLGGGNFAGYTTYGTLTALSVDGIINAVINHGDVAALSRIQQIQDPVFKVTGGELEMLGGRAYLVVGQDFEGEYNPVTNSGFTQTYTDAIQSFQISYNGQVPNSLGISDYQSQIDQVHLRRRDYNLGHVLQSNGQPALEIFGGVFTPGPLSLATSDAGFRNPILINGVGDTQVDPFQQAFSQYSSPHIGLFSANTGAMNTVFLGGISLYDVNFATGQLNSPFLNFPPTFPGLPFVNNVTTQVRQANGATQEYEMSAQLPGMYGSEARYFAAAGLPQYANGVLNLDQLLTQQPTTLGYVYGGIVSTVGMTSSSSQTMATNAIFKVTLVPNVSPPSNVTFVNSLSQVLLGHPADQALQTYWVNKLNHGVSRAVVAKAFIQMPEHRTLELVGYFNQFLNATLDDASKKLYLKAYAHGATDQQVIALILNSAQFRHTTSAFGQTGNSVLVVALYTDLFSRPPTSSEATYWTNRLNRGTKLPTMINTLLTSQEYRTKLVDGYYSIYLGRSADPVGERHWVKALGSQSSEQVLTSFLSSPEYFQNHPGAP